nr:MAG TPA: hypothetical protein [Caudoviricetes sp.]
MQDPQTSQNRKFKLGFKTPTSLVESVEPLQDVDYFDASLFSYFDYLTACENQISKSSEGDEMDERREVFVDFANVQDHEDQYFWLKYLKCYGQFIPVNIDLKFTSIFEKVAFGGQPCNTTSAFKGALEFVDRVGNDRAIVFFNPEHYSVIKKLNSLRRGLFDAKIALLDSSKRETNEKLFYDIENDTIKVDYVISISPIMQAASGIRLDRAETEIVGDLGFAQIAKINPTLAIQNIKAFKKLAEGLELTQEDFV